MPNVAPSLLLSRPARSLCTVTLILFTLLGPGRARAGDLAQVALGVTSLCAGFGMAVFATNTPKARLPLALGTCFGAGFSAAMPFAAMEHELAADALPLVAAPMGLLVVSSAVSLLIAEWELRERTRLVAATANGAAFGLGLWMLGGTLLADGTQALDVWHPLALGVAIASAGLAGAAGFATGTTESRSLFIGLTPLMGFFAGSLGVATYTLVQAARAERSDPVVLGALVAGGLTLGSVVGLLIAAAHPPGFSDESHAFAVSPMGLQWTF